MGAILSLVCRMLARVNGSLMIDGKPEGLLALEKVTVPLWSAGGTDT